MTARAAIDSIRTLHGSWVKTGLVLSIAFPWAGGEVVDFSADRKGPVLGVRDLYVLSDLPVDQRAGFLALLQSGAVIESLAVEPLAALVTPPLPKPKRRAHS